MEIFEDGETGFVTKTTNDKLIIEMPISNLVRGFNTSPYNYDGHGGNDTPAKIKKGMRKDFANYLANKLFDEADPDTGANYVGQMLDQLFIRAIEDDEEFLQYAEGE